MNETPAIFSTNFVKANIHIIKAILCIYYNHSATISSFGLIKTFIADLQRELFNFHYIPFK